MKSALALLLLAFAPLAAGQQYDNFGNPIQGSRGVVPPIGKPEGPRDRPPERDVPPPPLPTASTLVAFDVPQYYGGSVRLDRSSVVIGADDIVRYVLELGSADGGLEFSHEGIRCAPDEWKVLHRARGGGGWVRDFAGRWQRTNDAGPSAIRFRLAREFFCGPGGRPVGSSGEILDRMDADDGSVVRRRRDY